MSTTTLLLLAVAFAGAPSQPPLAQPPPPEQEDLRARLDAAGTSADHDGADAVVVIDHTRVQVEPSGLAHYRQRRVEKALTEAGATKLATRRFDYDPASNLVVVERARVHRRKTPDGAVPPPTDLGQDRLNDLPQPQHWIYWGPRMQVLSVPRLAVGDALEVETYKKGFIIAYLGEGEAAAPSGAASDEERYVPPMRGHFYDVVLFGADAQPTLDQRYEVRLPKDKPLQFEVYNGEVASSVTFDDAGTTYAFWKKDLPRHDPEPRAADASDYLPKVVMATVPDWQAKSRWFAQVNEAQFEVTDAVRAKADEITRGLASEDERIAAILHWTAQEIRYSGISMGKGEGYTLHSGDMTLHDRSGVCKDIAGMSITLLRAAGFSSYPAMTMAGSRVERIPADQFNHCVVAVKRPEGYRMIDPTWAPFSAELWSSAEREQHYVIGTPEGETLMMTPWLPPEHNRLEIRARSTVKPDGALESEVVVSGTGYLEDRLRRQIAYHGIEALRPSFSELLAKVGPAVELTDLRFSDHRALDQPFSVELRYRVPGYALAGERLIRTGIPTARHLLGGSSFADWLSATEKGTRTSAIWLRSPQLVTFDEELSVPAGFRLVGAPLDEQTRSKLGFVEARLRQEGDKLRFSEKIRIAARNVAPDDYPALKRLADAVRSLGERRFDLELEGGDR